MERYEYQPVEMELIFLDDDVICTSCGVVEMSEGLPGYEEGDV